MSPETPPEPEDHIVPESHEPAEDAAPVPDESPPPGYRPPWPPERPAAAPPPRIAARRPGGFRRLARTLFVWGFLLIVAFPVGLTLVYRFVPPPLTILMVQRLFQGQGLDYRWRPLKRISPALVQAVVASEDARFCAHNGFDFEAIQKAAAANKRRPNRIRGGSTISQQTAKNVFLWPRRSYLRKGLEAYYTVLIETLWGKRRIMEVYLNVAEMGAGTYGAEAAARRYFGVGADRLTRAQAARLAAILPNPLKYRAVNPGRYVARRSRRIGAAAGAVRNDGLAACVGPLRPAARAEKADAAPVQRPALRRPAPETKSEPLPPPPEPVEAHPPEVQSDPLIILDPPPEPEFKTTD